MGELVPVYAIESAPIARLRTEIEASEFEDQQSARWAKIIALAIFIIALILVPTFFVDDDQYQTHSSNVAAQVKRAG